MNESLFFLLAPELALSAGACIVLLLGLARSEGVRSCIFLIAFLTVLTSLGLACAAGPVDRPIGEYSVQLTNLGWYVRLITLGIGLIVLLVNHQMPHPEERSEAFSMILFSLTGILLTAMADDIVVLFLAIELASLPTYVLVAIGRTNIRAQEAGVKYFFLGALAAAVLAYGFSFLYGASGTTSLSRMTLDGGASWATIGLLLSFAGFSYKIAAVPFYAYAADVYQGAASPVTGLLGFFPKIAGFVGLIKVMLVMQPHLSPLGWRLSEPAFVFLWIAAAATMTIGNVLALMQSNVKRILAYSSIAHSGYMLIGVLAGPATGGGPLHNGLSAMLFYIAVYGIMNLGAFGVLALLQAQGKEVEELSDLGGLSRQHPLAALTMAICVFSLMGFPPTGGFLGKLYIFTSALSVDPSSPYRVAMIVLVVVGVINAAIAVGYYLRIIGACYVRRPAQELAVVTRTHPLQAGLLCCCLLILFIGLWPSPLMRMTRQPFDDLRPVSTMAETSPQQPR